MSTQEKPPAATGGISNKTANNIHADKDAVKSSVNLQDFAKSRGLEPLRGHKNRFPCPWRPGADSSGFVIDETGWYDHVQDEGGDAISFVEKLDGVDFKTALATLAMWAGIQGTAVATGWKEVDTYDFVDASGNLLYQEVRYEPKDFRLRRPNPDKPGEWTYSVKGIKRVPYRLPELAAAETVYVCEGPKDCNRLAGHGLTATCNAGGAGKFGRDWRHYFEKKNVVILADNDDPGRAHAEDVAHAVSESAASVKVVTPSEKEKGDASDFLDAGGTVEQLIEMVAAADAWKPSDKRADTSAKNGEKGGREKLQYAAMASEFVETVKVGTMPTVRFWQGGWWEYRGNCYRAMSTNDMRARVMDFLRADYWENSTRGVTENILANLQAFSLCGVPSHVNVPSWLSASYSDASGWLAFKNRCVHVSNLARHIAGENVEEGSVFMQTTPLLFSTFGLDYDHDPAATCPKWRAYLEGVQPNENDRLVLQKLAGLALIPETRYNVAFVLYGEAGTGKSVYLHVLQHLVGIANVCSLPLPQFDQRFSSWQLTTHLLNVVGDLPTEGEGHSLRAVEGMFKDVCDGGLVPVEHKHQEPSKAPAIARNVFATNSLPRFADRSGAIWDRLRIVPFEQRFRGTGMENRNLRFEIVEDELPGVFNWAVEGLARLLSDPAFPEHTGGIDAKEQHRLSCDPERVFLEEHFAMGTADDYVETRTAYRQFDEWRADNGYSRRTEGTFADAVRRVFHTPKERTRIGGEKRVIYPRLKVKT